MDDDGDVAPRYTIAHDILKEFRGVAISPAHQEVMMADKSGNAIFTFSFPEAWEYFEPVSAPPRSCQRAWRPVGGSYVSRSGGGLRAWQSARGGHRTVTGPARGLVLSRVCRLFSR